MKSHSQLLEKAEKKSGSCELGSVQENVWRDISGQEHSLQGLERAREKRIE